MGANSGGLAHLGERLPCKQKVAGSSPASSTTFYYEVFMIGVVILIALVALVWYQIPPEPEENVEARKRHGRADI